MTYVLDTNNITPSLVEAFASQMTPKSDLSLVGAFAQKTRPAKSKLPVLNVSRPFTVWDYYDYINATDDALYDIVEAYYEDTIDLMNEEAYSYNMSDDYYYEDTIDLIWEAYLAELKLDSCQQQSEEDSYQQQSEKDSWLQSIKYTWLVNSATDCYKYDCEHIEEWIHNCKINAEEAPYRKDSLQYIAREALESYINELHGRDTSFGTCGCGYGDIDFDIEVCSCYENANSDDSAQMMQLKTLQNNYKNSKDKIMPDLSLANKRMTELRIKHEAYLAELKLEFNVM